MIGLEGLRVVAVLLGALGGALLAAGLARVAGADELALSLIGGGGVLVFVLLHAIQIDRVRENGAAAERAARAYRLEAEADALRAKLEAPPEPEADAPDESGPARRALHWRIAAHRFILAGAAGGFTSRAMVGAGVVSGDGWQALVNVLVAAGVLMASKAGTRWAPGWNLERWQAERHTVALPHPDTEPPDVAIRAYSTTPQHQTAAAR